MEAGGSDRRSISRQLDRVVWRLDDLKEWRKEMDARVAVLESEVVTEKQARILSNVMREKEIADAVAERLSAERGHQPVATQWPLWQKLGAAIGALVVIVDSARGLIGH